jgi:steroid delta-isomerase-like uncharacterized protein
MLEDNKKVVLDCWEAANRHDSAALDKIYAEEVVYYGTDGEIRGRDNVKAFLGRYMEALPDLKLTVEDVVAEGDRVFSRARLEGTNTGAFNGMPPTGRRLDIRWIMNVVRIQDGKIAEEWEICDQFEILRQLGLADSAVAVEQA